MAKKNQLYQCELLQGHQGIFLENGVNGVQFQILSNLKNSLAEGTVDDL
jgi:hypothetical protein